MLAYQYKVLLFTYISQLANLGKKAENLQLKPDCLIVQQFHKDNLSDSYSQVVYKCLAMINCSIFDQTLVVT